MYVFYNLSGLYLGGLIMKIGRIESLHHVSGTKNEAPKKVQSFGMMSPPTRTLKDWDKATDPLYKATKKAVKALVKFVKDLVTGK